MAKAKAKSDAYRSSYEHINRMGFKEAWKLATDFDGGIPKEPPEDISEDAKRAILSLARLYEENMYQWS